MKLSQPVWTVCGFAILGTLANLRPGPCTVHDGWFVFAGCLIHIFYGEEGGGEKRGKTKSGQYTPTV